MLTTQMSRSRVCRRELAGPVYGRRDATTPTTLEPQVGRSRVLPARRNHASHSRASNWSVPCFAGATQPCLPLSTKWSVPCFAARRGLKLVLPCFAGVPVLPPDATMPSTLEPQIGRSRVLPVRRNHAYHSRAQIG